MKVRSVQLGLSVSQATARADELLRESEARASWDPTVQWNEDLPDVLHALCRILRTADPGDHAGDAKSVYQYALRLPWPDELADERSEILAALAYQTWSSCLRDGRFSEMRVFEAKCDMHAREQELVRDFLSVPLEQRSKLLSARFLSDASVLISAISTLDRLVNTDPRTTLSWGRQLLEWVSRDQSLRDHERSWFVCQLSVSIAGALRHLGHMNEAMNCLSRAESAFDLSRLSPVLGTRFEYARLTLLYDRREYVELLGRLPTLVSKLERYGSGSELAKGRLLHACALKAVGSPEAVAAFESLLVTAEIRDDRLLHGLTLMHLGNLLFEQGQCLRAALLCEQALQLLNPTGVKWAIADLHAVIAEALRQKGDLTGAERAFRSAIEACRSQGVAVRTSYLRVLLAETLIASQKEQDAVAELVAAIPVIERECLASEGLAAVALLREALTRREADSAAVRVLREELDAMRKRAGS